MAGKQKNLLAEMDVLSAEMERLFYRLFHPKLPLKTLGEPSWQPLTDIYETDASFLVKMDLAGMKEQDVTVRLEGDRLCVSGVRREQPAGKIRAYHQMEINYGRFERVILLRASIARNAVSAQFKDGFLEITIPKALRGEHVTRIKIVGERE